MAQSERARPMLRKGVGLGRAAAQCLLDACREVIQFFRFGGGFNRTGRNTRGGAKGTDRMARTGS